MSARGMFGAPSTHVALAGLAAVASGLLSLTPIGVAVDRFVQDVAIARLTPDAPIDPHIAIVAVTEETLAALPYRSPIDRTLLAEALAQIDAHQPRLVVLDILLDRPSAAAADATLRRALGELEAPILLAAPLEPPIDAAFFGWMTQGLPTAPAILPVERADGVFRGVPPNGVQGRATFAQAAMARLGVIAPQADVHVRFSNQTPIPTYASHHVGHLPPSADWLRGRIVFVGATLKDLDTVATPLRFASPAQPRLPSVVAHSYALRALLAPDHNRPPILTFTVIATAAAALFGAWAGRAGFAPGWTGAMILAAMALLLAGGFGLYAALDVLPAPAAPLGALALSGGAGAVGAARRNAQARARIDRAFRHYTPPAVVDRLARDPSAVRLHGEWREITVVRCDVAGFTAMCSRAAPGDVTAGLNAYFDVMIPIILAHGGTVDQILGDGMQALFGAPLTAPDHAGQALACMMALDRAAQGFRATARARALDWGATRIAAASGTCLTGSFGAQGRLLYTAYGPALNVAARLDAAAKTWGVRRIATAQTCAQAGWDGVRPIGQVDLRGLTEGLDVVEPGEGRDPAYDAAFALLDHDRIGARAAFQALRAARPDDGLVGAQADWLSADRRD